MQRATHRFGVDELERHFRSEVEQVLGEAGDAQLGREVVHEAGDAQCRDAVPVTDVVLEDMVSIQDELDPEFVHLWVDAQYARVVDHAEQRDGFLLHQLHRDSRLGCV